MSAYQESTLPLFHYYRQRGLLISIKADGDPLANFQRTAAAFKVASELEQQIHP
jgi:adenylate kinase family enzyme